MDRSTLADLMAAAELGAISPTTVVVAASEVDRMVKAAAEDARKAGELAGAQAATDSLMASGNAPALPAGMVPVPADTHDCGIAGCTHGASHDGPRQPDRQVKLQAPCGAVARMTSRALALAGGAISCMHGDAFVVATRRTYTKR